MPKHARQRADARTDNDTQKRCLESDSGTSPSPVSTSLCAICAAPSAHYVQLSTSYRTVQRWITVGGWIGGFFFRCCPRSFLGTTSCILLLTKAHQSHCCRLFVALNSPYFEVGVMPLILCSPAGPERNDSGSFFLLKPALMPPVINISIMLSTVPPLPSIYFLLRAHLLGEHKLNEYPLRPSNFGALEKQTQLFVPKRRAWESAALPTYRLIFCNCFDLQTPKTVHGQGRGGRDRTPLLPPNATSSQDIRNSDRNSRVAFAANVSGVYSFQSTERAALKSRRAFTNF